MQLYRIGQRIELHPATSAWMRGDRFGEIVGASRTRNSCTYSVRMDRSGRVLRVAQHNIYQEA